MDIILANQYKFIFILVRVSVILYFSAFFNSKNFPAIIKVALAFFIALLLTPVVKFDTASIVSSGDFLRVLFGEALIGLEIGLVLKLIIDIVAIFGETIDMSAGFNMAQTFDSMTNSQVSILGHLFSIITIAVIAASDIHHSIIDTVFNCFSTIPIGYFEIKINIIKYLTEGIVYGLAMAMPIVSIILILDYSIGLITKTIPQINIFSVGFIIKMFTGLILVYAFVLMFNKIIVSIAEVMINNIANL